MNDNLASPHLFSDRIAPRFWLIVAIAVASVLVAVLLAVWWLTDYSELLFSGMSEAGTVIIAFIICAAALSLIAAIACWKLYFGPKSRAFPSTGSSAIPIRNVPILGGFGRLVLWVQGETCIFLKNKQVASVGAEKGGTKLIFPTFGEEAVGPISLRTELLPWTDKQVLTREGQPVEVTIAILWKVAAPEKYAFKIASEIHSATTSEQFRGNSQLASENTVVDPHKPAASWLTVWVESAVRSRVNRLGMADLVSVQAPTLVQPSPDARTLPPEEQDSFESLIEPVLETVRKKALDYGITVERMDVQAIKLPEPIQKVINAFLLPLQSEQEAKARAISIRKEMEVYSELLGPEAFRLNELLKNFKGANFGFLGPLQALFGSIDQQTGKMMAAVATAPQLTAEDKPAKSEAP